MSRPGAQVTLERAAALLRPGALLVAGRGGGLDLFLPDDGYAARVDRLETGLAAAMEEGGDLVADARGRRVVSAAGRRRLAARFGLDPAQTRHRALSLEMDDGAARLVDLAESPLAWLARRGRGGAGAFLGREEFEAGERLRRDFTQAGLEPSMGLDVSAPRVDTGRRGGGAAAFQEGVVAARQRLDRALGAVGPELSGILTDVCCFLKGLEAAEKAHGWPRRSAKVVLRLGLQRLARHYGLLAPEAAASPGGARPRLRHWGAADYRPRSGE